MEHGEHMLLWTLIVVVALVWSRWYFVSRRLRALNIELCRQRLVNLQNRLLVETYVRKTVNPQSDFFETYSELISISADPKIWIVDARQVFTKNDQNITNEDARARFSELIELAGKAGEIGQSIANEYVQASAKMLFTVNPVAKVVALLTMHLFSRAWGTMTGRIERALERFTKTEDDILVLAGMNTLAEATGKPIAVRLRIFDKLSAAIC